MVWDSQDASRAGKLSFHTHFSKGEGGSRFWMFSKAPLRIRQRVPRESQLCFSQGEKDKTAVAASSRPTDFRKWRLPCVLESTGVYNLEHHQTSFHFHLHALPLLEASSSPPWWPGYLESVSVLPGGRVANVMNLLSFHSWLPNSCHSEALGLVPLHSLGRGRSSQLPPLVAFSVPFLGKAQPTGHLWASPYFIANMQPCSLCSALSTTITLDNRSIWPSLTEAALLQELEIDFLFFAESLPAFVLDLWTSQHLCWWGGGAVASHCFLREYCVC